MTELGIAGELADARKLIMEQVTAGMGEADVTESLARSYEARIADLPALRSEQRTQLTSAVNGGPWSKEQKKMLAAAVLNNGGRKGKSSSTRSKNQRCHHIENLLPTSTMAKLKDVLKYSKTSRMSIIAAAGKSLGIVNPDEITLFRMVSIIAVCDPSSTFTQHDVWDYMSVIQKFMKAGGASKVEYISEYPPTAELLPEAIQKAAYACEPNHPPELDWPELDTILGHMNKRGKRSSGSTDSTSRKKSTTKNTQASQPAAADTPPPAATSPLPNIDVWRLASSAGSRISSPPEPSVLMCERCRLPLTDGHVHSHDNAEKNLMTSLTQSPNLALS